MSMNEQELVYLLSQYENIKLGIQLIKKQIFSALSEIETEESLIRQLTFPGYGQVSSKCNTIKTDKILEITEAYKKIKRKQGEEWQKSISLISMQEECLNTIMSCLHRLDEPKRSILILIFIEKNTWNCICNLLHISSTTLSRLRNEGIVDLLNTYNKIDKNYYKDIFALKDIQNLLLSKNKSELKRLLKKDEKYRN